MDHSELESEHVCQPASDLCFITKLTPLYSWDIWRPPVWGGSYWASAVQYRALIEGAQFGRKIGREGDADLFESLASLVLDYAQERLSLSISLASELKRLISADILERKGRIYE